MRMSKQGFSAYELVNQYTERELADIFFRYGEESYARQIAKKIVNERAERSIETTLQLAEVIKSALPPAVRRKDKHPARKVFQAIRIEVNGELTALDEALDQIVALLNPGGRLCVITFHSLEDRLVKQKIREWETACTCPPEFPVCVCRGKAKVRRITKKPTTPTESEIKRNPRSRSAKLRICEKI
ncbi:Ribosomal RNA small subunit methyltransferase H [bioreactor metagenome]|uniref:Ribosomal RNA small subunit methyltransferase H n=1 Tax=bioreactor metagenome TaxID=1076179 RepID=A0A645I1U4_9ZZZZ